MEQTNGVALGVLPLVGDVECGGDFLNDLEDGPIGRGPVVHHVVEGDALDVLHDDGPAPLELDQTVDADDRAMAKETEQAGLIA